MTNDDLRMTNLKMSEPFPPFVNRHSYFDNRFIA